MNFPLDIWNLIKLFLIGKYCKNPLFNNFRTKDITIFANKFKKIYPMSPSNIYRQIYSNLTDIEYDYYFITRDLYNSFWSIQYCENKHCQRPLFWNRAYFQHDNEWFKHVILGKETLLIEGKSRCHHYNCICDVGCKYCDRPLDRPLERIERIEVDIDSDEELEPTIEGFFDDDMDNY